MRDKQLHGEKLSTGQAIITDGYNLPAKYVIHTVGPVWNERDDNQEAQLAECYRNSLQLAARRQVSHIVFPSISTGVYSFPIDLAAKTAISTIKDFLADHNFGNVTMVLFSDNDYEAYVSALKNLSDS